MTNATTTTTTTCPACQGTGRPAGGDPSEDCCRCWGSGQVEAEAQAAVTLSVPAEAACSCRCWDDGDGESGPHLQVEPDEACPEHGRAAYPVEWAESDVETERFDRARLASYRWAARREMPGCYDASVIDAWARAGMAAEDAYYANEEAREQARHAVEAAQATYDRRRAHQGRVERYYDDCPDGDPRKASQAEACALVGARVAEARAALSAAIDALETLGGVA